MGCLAARKYWIREQKQSVIELNSQKYSRNRWEFKRSNQKINRAKTSHAESYAFLSLVKEKCSKIFDIGNA